MLPWLRATNTAVSNAFAPRVPRSPHCLLMLVPGTSSLLANAAALHRTVPARWPGAGPSLASQSFVLLPTTARPRVGCPARTRGASATGPVQHRTGVAPLPLPGSSSTPHVPAAPLPSPRRQQAAPRHTHVSSPAAAGVVRSPPLRAFAQGFCPVG